MDLITLYSTHCPKCNTANVRIKGCNDFVCAYCGIFYRWDTLTIQTEYSTKFQRNHKPRTRNKYIRRRRKND